MFWGGFATDVQHQEAEGGAYRYLEAREGGFVRSVVGGVSFWQLE